MRRVVWVMVGWLAIGPEARTVDAGAGEPYDFHVIVRVAPHRLLTETFRRQLQDDLKDNLQAAFGTLARVQVRDAAALPESEWLPLSSLDTTTTLRPDKRHFVEVAYANGQYHVQARQHDGSTGMASPVVRQDQTSDRAFVARLITRLIDQDFGAVGMVVSKDGDRVRLRIRGGAIPGANLARWVPSGSVFALVRIEGEPQRGRPVEAALLRTTAEPRDGECECQFFYRFRDAQQRDPLADWEQVTFRALRLGTVAAPVRLRVVDGDDLPVTDVQVRISPVGFTDPPRDRGAVRGNGSFESAGPYEHVAFVRVSSGDQPLARVPVAVLGDRVIVCQVDKRPHGEARQQVEIDARNLRQRLHDIVRRLREQRRHLITILKAAQNKEALSRVSANLSVLDAELSALTIELGRVRGEAQQVGASVGPALEQCDVYLKEIRKQKETLAQAQTGLEQAVKAENSPEEQQKREGYLGLLQQAEACREEAEFDKAIETYEEILQKYGERPEVRKRLSELKAAWELKGDDHRKARAFAYGPWAAVRTYDEVRERLPKAREAFDACRAARDRLTALKLFLVASTTATEVVVQRAEELGMSQAEEDKLNLKQAHQVSQDLHAFIKEMQAFMQPEEK